MLAFSSLTFAADSGLSPSSVKVTVYSVALSTSTDCTNPTVIASYPSGKEFDFMQNPAILSGTIADGTYPCIILQMSDQIKVTPSSTSTTGNCVAGTEFTNPICKAANSQAYQSMTVNSDNSASFSSVGTCTAAVGNTGEVVPLFLSTASTLSTGNLVPFVQPSAANAASCVGSVKTGCGIKLSSSFTVAGSGAGTFVVDFTGQLSDSGGLCNLNAPAFSFR